MDGEVKTRRYRSTVRAAKAAATRRAILRAARELLTTDGYGCTVAQVADRAGVAVDTVYASVGRKPELILAVIDMVLGDADEPVPVGERGYVLRIQAAATAEQKIAVYADALGTLLPSVAPLQEALRQAGQSEPECARVWTRLVERRAANMLLFARELRGTGQLRKDLDDQQVADIVWATNSAEYFLLLAQRGWSPEEFAAHLNDTWCRTLLDRSAGTQAATADDVQVAARGLDPPGSASTGEE
jgi:AcrR family transcriptional regulator